MLLSFIAAEIHFSKEIRQRYCCYSNSQSHLGTQFPFHNLPDSCGQYFIYARGVAKAKPAWTLYQLLRWESLSPLWPIESPKTILCVPESEQERPAKALGIHLLPSPGVDTESVSAEFPGLSKDWQPRRGISMSMVMQSVNWEVTSLRQFSRTSGCRRPNGVGHTGH